MGSNYQMLIGFRFYMAAMVTMGIEKEFEAAKVAEF